MLQGASEASTQSRQQPNRIQAQSNQNVSRLAATSLKQISKPSQMSSQVPRQLDSKIQSSIGEQWLKLIRPSPSMSNKLEGTGKPPHQRSGVLNPSKDSKGSKECGSNRVIRTTCNAHARPRTIFSVRGPFCAATLRNGTRECRTPGCELNHLKPDQWKKPRKDTMKIFLEKTPNMDWKKKLSQKSGSGSNSIRRPRYKYKTYLFKLSLKVLTTITLFTFSCLYHQPKQLWLSISLPQHHTAIATSWRTPQVRSFLMATSKIRQLHASSILAIVPQASHTPWEPHKVTHLALRQSSQHHKEEEEAFDSHDNFKSQQ